MCKAAHGDEEPRHGDEVAGAGIDLSVIMPTYRDGARIYTHLCQLDAALKQVPYTYELSWPRQEQTGSAELRPRADPRIPRAPTCPTRKQGSDDAEAESRPE